MSDYPNNCPYDSIDSAGMYPCDNCGEEISWQEGWDILCDDCLEGVAK